MEAFVIIPDRDDSDLDHSGSSRGGEILSCPGYILKVELTGLLTSQKWI